MLLVCYNLLNSQNISINNSEKKVGDLDAYDVTKKVAEIAQKKEQ